MRTPKIKPYNGDSFDRPRSELIQNKGELW